MNPELFEHYKRELQHVREMGGAFADEFPKIAGRLGLEKLECADPYVERLLEGFAFLAARVQLRIEHSETELARRLLEMVHPASLAPTPAMVIAEFEPSMREGSLAAGFRIERGTRLRSRIAADERTECEFRTAHDLVLRPLKISDVRVIPSTSALRMLGIDPPAGVRGGLLIDVTAVGGHRIAELDIDTLSFHLTGADDTGARLYEHLFRFTRHATVLDGEREIRSPSRPPKIARRGFEDHEALLPVSARGFQGYRLLQEYFAFPARYHFLALEPLAHRLSRIEGDTARLVLLFDEHDDSLADFVDVSCFRLHAVPAINLFSRSADRIHLDPGRHEYHVLPDRTRPMDFEVWSVDGVEGHGGQDAARQRFYPLYSVNERRREAAAFFSARREPRLLSSRQRRRGPRSSYIGSEVFLTLVDADAAPFHPDLRQLSLDIHCTNRDLPLQMPVGAGDTDFLLDIGAPVDAVRCIAGPTVPRPSRAGGHDAWRLVSNLSLNHLSIDDGDGGERSAALLRQMLGLYVDERRSVERRQLDGILAVRTRPTVRQRQAHARIEIAHGLEITVRLDDNAFEGIGAYLLGAVLERFFARHANVNAFTETVLETQQRGELERWPVRLGERYTP